MTTVDKAKGDIALCCPTLYFLRSTQLFPFPCISKSEAQLATQCYREAILEADIQGVPMQRVHAHRFGFASVLP